MKLRGFFAYPGFSKPEFIAETLRAFRDNVVISEGLLLASNDVTNNVMELLEDEIHWIKKIHNVEYVDLSNSGVVEDLKGFFHTYGIFLNPSKDELQQFNVSVGLDKNSYIEDLFH